MKFNGTNPPYFGYTEEDMMSEAEKENMLKVWEETIPKIDKKDSVGVMLIYGTSGQK